MRPRFLLREGSPGGERELARYDEPEEALQDRDDLRIVQGGLRRVFDVIDLEHVDLGSPGLIDWCERCGEKRAAIWRRFEGLPLCGVCTAEAEAEFRAQIGRAHV